MGKVGIRLTLLVSCCLGLESAFADSAVVTATSFGGRASVLMVEESPDGNGLDPLLSAIEDCQRAPWGDECNVEVIRLPFKPGIDPADQLLAARRDIRHLVAVMGVSTELAQRLGNSFGTTPIIFDGYHDPRRSCLVRTLSRPGGSATGVFAIPEVGERMIDTLARAYPSTREVVVLIDETELGQWDCGHLRSAKPALDAGCRAGKIEASRASRHLFIPPFIDAARARHLGISFWQLCASEAVSTLAAISKMRNVGIVVPTRESFYRRREELVRTINSLKLPAIYQGTRYTKAGGLAAVRSQLANAPESMVNLLRRILGGSLPADLPVEQPMQSEIVFNKAAARLLNERPTGRFLRIVDEFVDVLPQPAVSP